MAGQAVYKKLAGKVGAAQAKAYLYGDASIINEEAKSQIAEFYAGNKPSRNAVSTEEAGELAVKNAKGTMSSNDIDALSYYTAEGYENMNGALRSGSISPNMKKDIDSVSSAIKSLPKWKGEVLRGMNVSKYTLDSFISKFEKGKTVEFPAFTSTTFSKNSSFLINMDKKFNVHMKIKAKGKSGAYVGSLSTLKGEKEVLFDKKTRFKVVGVKERSHAQFGMRYDITLEEI